MKKIFEERFPKSRILVVEHSTEDKDGKEKSVLLSGLFCLADTPSGTGRLYPQSVLEDAVQKVQQHIKEHGPLFSGGAHPETGTIEIPSVSHQIESVWQNPDDVKQFHCNLRIIGTSQGKNLWTLISNGGAVGLGMVGSGETVAETKGNKKIEVVQDGYILQRIDAVLAPGFNSARVNSGSAVFESLDLEANKEIQLSEQEKFSRFVEARKSASKDPD